MAATADPLSMTSHETAIRAGTLSLVNTAESSSQGSSSSLQMLTSSQYQPLYMRPGYRFKTNLQQNAAEVMPDGPGRRLRKNVANVRRHIDYISNVLNHFEKRLWQYGPQDRIVVEPDILYQNSALLPSVITDKAIDCVMTKFVRAAMNKVKCPIYSICWTPEGKRLITGASTGEFTLWNGTAFNFETILQAHDTAIRAMKWSHNDQWLISADHDGFIKYWQPNMNNVHMYQAHKDEPIRAISISPTDVKLVTGSDDGTARIWDFARCAEEKILRGHGSDVRSVDWHPQKGLICTGSRDSQQPVKLWDPKSGQCLSTLHDHKNSVMAVQWNRNGNWLLTGSRDHLIKMYDIRMMREMHTYRGHKKEVTALAWHPVHESLFVSGGGDGSLAYWLVNNEKELGFLEHAHDQAIWTLEWHPLGHILASGSNDNNTKFWARNRPGDTQDDIFGLSSFTGIPAQATSKESKADNSDECQQEPVIPGMGLDDTVFEGMQNKEAKMTVGGPPIGGPLLFPEDPNTRQQSLNIGAKRTLIKQPPPKKAQRQFERMWNVAKPGGADDYDDETFEESGSFRRSKASLLGPPPRSLLSTKRADSEAVRSPSPEREKGQVAMAGGGQTVQEQENQTPPTMLTMPPGLGNPGVIQQWPNAAGPAQTPIIQQVSAPATVILNPAVPIPSMPQLGVPTIPLPGIPIPPAGGPLIWPPPLPAALNPSAPAPAPPPAPAPAPTPNATASAQNRDTDYRLGPPTIPMPSAIPSTSNNSSSDVDLRSQNLSTSNSWRPSKSTENLQQDSDDSLHPGAGEARIHDPRMRRNASLMHDSRSGAPEQGNPSHQQMRDPRRRPQPLVQQPQQGNDFSGSTEGIKSRRRVWMPAMNEAMNRSSPSKHGYNDMDDRPYQQNQAGGPVRRPAQERTMGRGRGRKPY